MTPRSERNAPPKPPRGARKAELARVARLALNARRVVYAKVDLREGGLCRFTRRAGWLEHHHIVHRSQGGADTTGNVVLLSKFFHDGLHAKRYILTGDADGTLCLEDTLTGVCEMSPVPALRD